MLLNCHPGLLQKLMDYGYYAAYGRKNITGGSELRQNKPITQQNMFVIYIGLGMGALLALTTFVIEIAFWKCGECHGQLYCVTPAGPSGRTDMNAREGPGCESGRGLQRIGGRHQRDRVLRELSQHYVGQILRKIEQEELVGVASEGERKGNLEAGPRDERIPQNE